MSTQNIEISVGGKWTTVPAVFIQQKHVITTGKILRIARIHDEEWLESELEDPDACVRELKKSGIAADLFTFCQKPPTTTPRYGYPSEFESIAVVRTTDFQAWWEGLPRNTRQNVRRSQKRGVVVTVQPFDDALVEGIAAVNNESPVKQGRANRHYGKTLEQVRKDHESFLDRSEFVCACAGTELIGYVKIVYRGCIASILNIVSKTCHQDKRPSNALLAKAVELCQQRGITYLTYGKYCYGNKQNSPLLEFKRRNGFCEILMPRFYVPLTAWGAVCVKLRLYRGPVGVLPPRMIDVGLKVRAKLYQVKAAGQCGSNGRAIEL